MAYQTRILPDRGRLPMETALVDDAKPRKKGKLRISESESQGLFGQVPDLVEMSFAQPSILRTYPQLS